MKGRMRKRRRWWKKKSRTSRGESWGRGIKMLMMHLHFSWGGRVGALSLGIVALCFVVNGECRCPSCSIHSPPGLYFLDAMMHFLPFLLSFPLPSCSHLFLLSCLSSCPPLLLLFMLLLSLISFLKSWKVTFIEREHQFQFNNRAAIHVIPLSNQSRDDPLYSQTFPYTI